MGDRKGGKGGTAIDRYDEKSERRGAPKGGGGDVWKVNVERIARPRGKKKCDQVEEKLRSADTFFASPDGQSRMGGHRCWTVFKVKY